ncbi:hypothetical protein GS4_47_00090 [Gordonia soli NBRC 108243]|uniref:Terminase large subunit n=1 Tax=Gordonia soli NBRC 108243 TaxID=1223545 RepID=M0QRD6_9ACTN|nr:hypothetical protein GS4_47_00090 [Gordonia soli NBRC 108243]
MPGLAPLGHRQPRVHHQVAGAVDFERGEEALDIAWTAGATLLDWQCDVVRQGMARTETGRWAAREVGLLVARQNGKTASIEVVELAWMLKEPGVHILHTAHEFQTALESMGRLQGLINSHPLLEDQVDSIRIGNGKEWIRLKNGSEIRYRTRTKSGLRGFSVDRLVIDEAMIWSKASQAAIRPLLTTAKNLQIWYLGSAADAEVHEHCGKWASLRDAAMSANPPKNLLWMEWSAPEPPARTDDALADIEARAAWRADPNTWAAANPSLGHEVEPGYALVSHEYIEDELDSFRNALEEWEIERLSYGRWPSSHAAHEPIIKGWSDMRNRSPRLTGPIAVGLELSPDRRRWVFAAAQRTDDGRTHVEVGWPESSPDGSGLTNDQAVAFVVRMAEAWDPVAVVIDSRSPTAVIVPKLIAVGIEPEKATTPQMAAWSGGFLDDAVAGLLSHTDQPALTRAVETVVKRDLPQGDFVWTRTDDGSTAPMIAATLAHGGLVSFGYETATERALPSAGGRRSTPTTPTRSSDLDLLSIGF